MNYGFRRRSDLKNATALARNAMAPVLAQAVDPVLARMYVCKVPEGGMEAVTPGDPDADPPTEDKASKTECEVHLISSDGELPLMPAIKLGDPNADPPTEDEYQKLEVYNSTNQSYDEGEYVVCGVVGGRVSVVGTPAGGEAKVVHFAIAENGEFEAGFADASVMDPLNSGLQIADPIVLYDPIGEWDFLKETKPGVAVYAGKKVRPDQNPPPDPPLDPAQATDEEVDIWVIVYANRDCDWLIGLFDECQQAICQWICQNCDGFGSEDINCGEPLQGACCSTDPVQPLISCAYGSDAISGLQYENTASPGVVFQQTGPSGWRHELYEQNDPERDCVFWVPFINPNFPDDPYFAVVHIDSNYATFTSVRYLEDQTPDNLSKPDITQNPFLTFGFGGEGNGCNAVDVESAFNPARTGKVSVSGGVQCEDENGPALMCVGDCEVNAYTDLVTDLMIVSASGDAPGYILDTDPAAERFTNYKDKGYSEGKIYMKRSDNNLPVGFFWVRLNVDGTCEVFSDDQSSANERFTSQSFNCNAPTNTPPFVDALHATGQCSLSLILNSPCRETIKPANQIVAERSSRTLATPLPTGDKEQTGTMLKHRNPELFRSSCSGCKDVAATMNASGIAGSQQNIDDLTRRMVIANRRNSDPKVQALSDEQVKTLIQWAIDAEKTRLGK